MYSQGSPVLLSIIFRHVHIWKFPEVSLTQKMIARANLEEENKLIETGFEFIRYSEKTKWPYIGRESKKNQERVC